MADNTIKVTVLEGVSASLSALGLPLPVCLQLQLSGLKLSEAMWTAKSSSAGFSVSLFWPSLEQQVGGVVTAIPKRKKRRRRHKAKTCTTPGSPVAHLLAAEVCESKVPQDPTPISTHHDKSSGNQKAESGSGDVVAVDETDDEQWTRVERRRRKKRQVPLRILKRRYRPPDAFATLLKGELDQLTSSDNESLCSSPAHETSPVTLSPPISSRLRARTKK